MTRQVDFLIFRQVDEGPAETWLFCGQVTSTTQKSAIKEHMRTHGNQEGTYVAVFARDWNPTKAVVVTVTEIALS